ncbi:MAG: hypothetical protein Q8Q23_01015 [bacterium]|nr:hypothetical protein [bacterium]
MFNSKPFVIFLRCGLPPLGNIFLGLLCIGLSICVGLGVYWYPKDWENSTVALSFGLFMPLFMAYYCFQAAWQAVREALTEAKKEQS